MSDLGAGSSGVSAIRGLNLEIPSALPSKDARHMSEVGIGLLTDQARVFTASEGRDNDESCDLTAF